MLADLAGQLQIDPWPPVADAPYWAALALVVGGLAGEAATRWLALPRIVGYGLVGLLVGLAGLGPAEGRPLGGVRLVIDMALGLLLFELGSRVRLRWLRDNPALWITGLAEALLSLLVLVVAMRLLGIAWPAALALGTILVPASGAVVSRVATEVRASGQVTERMTVLTALHTLFAVLAAKLVSGWLHVDLAGQWVPALAQPLYTFGGSVLLAWGLARVVALGGRRIDLRQDHAALLLLGLIVLATMSARMLGLSTLLVPLAAGVLLRHASPRPWIWPRHFGTAGAALVLMLFVAVGSAPTPAALALGAGTAVLLLAVRLAAKAAAVLLLAPWSGLQGRQAVALVAALSPVSATALVLYADFAGSHPMLAPALAPVVLSAVAIMALLGPLAVQWGLTLADEPAPVARSSERGALE